MARVSLHILNRLELKNDFRAVQCWQNWTSPKVISQEHAR